MFTKKNRFIGLLVLVLFTALVSLADSAIAGKDGPDAEQRIRNQNALGQLLSPNR